MKKLFILFILLALCGTTLFAQAPEKFSYQAVVRNSNNQLVTNAPVSVRVSILQESTDGKAVYVETHTASTNANGLLTVEVGGGKAEQGDFANIDWANGPYFLKTETDPNGGSDYGVTITQQLLSVPYALYAKEAANGFSGDYNDLKNKPTIPQNVGELANDAGYITLNDLPAQPKGGDSPKDAGVIQTTTCGEVDLCSLLNRMDAMQSQMEDMQEALLQTVEDGSPCPGTPTVTDIDGNVYNTVKIGDYCWMKENLRTKHFADGTPIPAGGKLNSITVPYYYDNNGSNIPLAERGYLYNFIAAKAACPQGWHLPTDQEWSAMEQTQTEMYIPSMLLVSCGDHAGRLSGGSYWDPTTNANAPGNMDYAERNASGFSAVPAGIRSPEGRFTFVGVYAMFWTYTDYNTSAIKRGLYYSSASVYHSTSEKEEGLSVRCIRGGGTASGGELPSVQDSCNGTIPMPYFENFESYTTSTTAATGVEPSCWQLVHEDVTMTDANRPQLYYKSDFAHSGNYSLKLYNRGIYAMPELDNETAINHVKLDMYLRQANAKYLLQVGVWDGQTFVPVATFDNSTTDVEHVTCDFSSYNGNGRRIAFRNTLSSGSTLAYSTNYLDDIYLTVNVENCSITLPYSEDFENYTSSTSTATGVEPNCWELVREDVTMTNANRPQLYYNSNFTHSGNYSLKLYNRGIYAMPELDNGIAINQVKLEMYLRQANAKYQLQVGVWDGQTFVPVATFNNNTTDVEYVTCDFSSYNGNGHRIAFRNTLSSGTNLNYSTNYLDDIMLKIPDGMPCPGTPTVSDHEGNVYNTVQIGNQCWMRDNLRTTTSPSTGTYLVPDPRYDFTNVGKQAFWFWYDSAWYAPRNYGMLYNWNAAVDTFNTNYGETYVNTCNDCEVSVNFTGHRRGICPSGWHLPSNAEWTTLTDYISSQPEYTCGGSSNNIAKALASTTWWYSHSGECNPGNQSVMPNNTSGFDAIPAGESMVDGFDHMNETAKFWTTDAYTFALLYNYPSVQMEPEDKHRCRSVRCLRD